MPKLTEAGRQARIADYRSGLLQKLSGRVINTRTTHADLVSDQGKPMASLDGEIILEKDLYPDGKLRGVVSVHPDALAAILPDIKADKDNRMGWKRHLDKFKAEGVDITAGVSDPQPSEYEP